MSEAWDMDRSLGWQGSSVPEDRTEAGVRCYSGRWGGPDLSSPCLDGDWGSKSKNDLVTVKAGGEGGQIGGEDPSVLTPCLEPLWIPPDEQPRLAGNPGMLVPGDYGRWGMVGVPISVFFSPLTAAPLLSALGETRWRTVFSLSLGPSAGSLWGYAERQDFLEFPRLELPENKTCCTPSPSAPAPSPLCCHIMNSPSWDTLRVKRGTIHHYARTTNKLGWTVTPLGPHKYYG